MQTETEIKLKVIALCYTHTETTWRCSLVRLNVFNFYILLNLHKKNINYYTGFKEKKCNKIRYKIRSSYIDPIRYQGALVPLDIFENKMCPHHIVTNMDNGSPKFRLNRLYLLTDSLLRCRSLKKSTSDTTNSAPVTKSRGIRYGNSVETNRIDLMVLCMFGINVYEYNL